MKAHALQAAEQMAQKLGHVIVATADENGWPHVAAARKLRAGEEMHLAVWEWFCPATVANVQRNRRVSIVVWDAASDQGMQILGQVERIEDMAILDGYSPEEPRPPLPQVERRLHVRVDKVLHFSHGPHSDVEE